MVYFGKKPEEAQATQSPEPSYAASEETAVPPSVAGDESAQSASPSPSPTEPAVAAPDLAARDPVEDSYFLDAAFMGNSLMDGFRLFSGLTTCDYYAATSMTVVAATSKACITLDNGNSGTLVDGLTQKPYGKIYILLGINEIGFDTQTFIDYYSAMLDTIISAQPDCDIYIMGITPVSKAKSDSSTTFNMTRINEYNTALRQLAADKGCYYMDLVSALAGPDGYLPAEETTDGVHFSANVYQTWLDYVRTHYA
ncbi:MAG: GDSL-type esterase/lipase family protein [Oscillospiraceae bacterium]